MNITSVEFLFLFFPLGLLVYYLIPAKKTLRWRNLFLVVFSLFFYAWGDILPLALMLGLVVVTWLLGRAVEGKKGAKKGKNIVRLSVLVSVGVLFIFKYLDFTLSNIGALIRHPLPSLALPLPLGLSFFCFQSISYVVDIYRGKAKPQKNILDAALYLMIFFKITSGPIMQYNQFEKQITERTASFDGVCEGMWRFALGLGKKAILAAGAGHLVTAAFSMDTAQLPVALAWLGSAGYMLQVFFDFAGYSDMAIGLGRMFGFEIPENFLYPYTATSVTTYWQKWHITLGAWFRDYMFYPLTLGPAIRMRKKLIKRGMNKDKTKILLNIFVVGAIWMTTGIWHGAKWNYLVWGLINGIFIVWETYRKPLKNKKLDTVLGWLYTMGVCFFTKGLVYLPTLTAAGSFYKVMFGFGKTNPFWSDYVGFLLREYKFFLIIGVLCCFPLYTTIKKKLVTPERAKLAAAVRVAEAVLLLAVFVLSAAFVVKNGHTAFIYQRF